MNDEIMPPAKSPWECVACGAGYAEYVNGCPKCWENGIRSKVEKTNVPGPREVGVSIAEKQYTGTVLSKGVDAYGAFIKLRVTDRRGGKHEMGFEVEERNLDLYEVGQIASVTAIYPDAATDEEK